MIEYISDASFGNLEGRSQEGYVIILCINEMKCLLTWQLRQVLKSAIVAETLAMLDTAEIGTGLGVISKVVLKISEDLPIGKCYVDNKVFVESVYSIKLVQDK